MSCETLKAFVLYGGGTVLLVICVLMTLIQNRMNALIKSHGLTRSDFKKNALSIPKDVTAQVTKLKKIAFLLVFTIALWATGLYLVVEYMCPSPIG